MYILGPYALDIFHCVLTVPLLCVDDFPIGLGDNVVRPLHRQEVIDSLIVRCHLTFMLRTTGTGQACASTEGCTGQISLKK